MSEMTYTYQGGKRLPLSRVTTHFISRATQNDLLADNFQPLQAVSPHAWAVKTTEGTIDDDIRRARRLGPAYTAYLVADSGSKFIVTDRVFVRFHRTADATETSARQFGSRLDMTLLQRLSPRDCLFRVAPNLDVVEMVCRLTEREAAVVEVADHDLNIQPQENDPLARLQWYLHAEPPENDPLIARCSLIDCEGAWEKAGQGNKDVVIAVIDCGCDLTDPNFGDQKFAAWAILIDGEVYSHDDWERAQQMMEPSRLHGTLCATLAAASANAIGGVGAAPDCRLLPVKWQELTNGQVLSQSLFGSIIGFLRDKVDVVSSSWSLSPDGYWPPAIVDALADAAMNGGRSGKGIVWVWSAGNQNCPIDHDGTVSVPTKVRSTVRGGLVVEGSSTRFRNSFAGVPGVLHVGAISSLGQRCHYSNYGKGLDLVAPSTNNHLYGRLSVSGTTLMVPLRAQGLYPFGGTSAAAPLVAGVAALVRSANPELTALEIASILKRTADKELQMAGYPPCSKPGDLPHEDWDVSPIPPFDNGAFGGSDPDGTWSPWFGFGKVNARRAVEEALRH